MFIIYDKDMNVKELPEGAYPLDIFISSIQEQSINEAIEGMSGSVYYGSNFLERDISIDLGLFAKDTRDYRLLRDQIYGFFKSMDYFYISEEYQRGKRYKVKATDSFIPDRHNYKVASLSIVLEVIGLPYAESIGTTQDIEENGVDANDELWGFGMGLTSGENLKYTHNGNNFSVFNAGNVGVHPFEQELKIIINNVTRPLNYLELKNETNGSSFRITVKVHEGDEIVYDGANIRINGLEALRRTNRKYIQLNPGWNNFKLDGAESAEISMFFRFYYL